MKRLLSTLVLVSALVFPTGSVCAQSFSNIFKAVGNKTTQTTDTASTGSSGGSLGGLISGVASALGLGSNSAGIDRLAGTWAYSGPAVSFKSDNFLLKAGGAAAATTVEKKIEPYYKTAGLNNLVVTINADSTFTFKTNRVTLNGTLAYDSEAGGYIFKFQALKKIPVGSMQAYIQLTGNSDMQLTFDVTKLMTIVQRVSAMSGQTSLKTLSTLLEQYDGMTAGFDLKRTN